MSLLHKKCLLGERLSDELLLDCHAHVGRHADYVIPWNQPEELAEEMQRLNVRGTFIFQFTGIASGEVSYGNDVVADACRRVPGRFLGLAMVNPWFERDVLRELDRCRSMGFVGIKLITGYQGYPDDGPMFDVIASFADTHSMPVICHNWGGQLEGLLGKYPRAQFITAHWAAQTAPLVAAYQNLWVCTCLPSAHESFEAGMRVLRPDRVLWGSDMSDLEMGAGLGPILLARQSDDIKRRVIGLNMRDLLRTCGIPEPPAW